MDKPMTKEIAQKMLQSNEESLRDLALLHYPELGSIMDRVKTYEDACRVLGVNPDIVISDVLSNAEIAYRKLCVVIKTLNGDWKPCFGDSNQYKYFPYFKLEDGCQVFDGVVGWSAGTLVPAPSLFKSRELAEYAGTQFIDLYRDWLQMGDYK